MLSYIPLLVLFIFGAGIIYYLFVRRPAQIRKRREAVKANPFPEEWKEILKQYVPVYHYLPNDFKKELQGHIQVFLEEKYFEGCAGVEINDTIRVCIAAQACVLLLNRDTDYYPTLNTILVYPAKYIAKETVSKDGLISLDNQSVRLGESWKLGIVVLAWDHVQHGARGIHDGQNLVYHEFAHQLDEEDGSANGTPMLESRTQYATWSRILTQEFKKLRRSSSYHRSSVLDQYGATNPAEFFAVATEAFFEKPLLLKKRHAALYNELQAYYKVDPAEWF